MASEPIKFELPPKMEKVLASLSAYYTTHNKTGLQRLIVNARYSVKESWDYDNWNGGTYGHALFLQLPSALYYEVVDKAAHGEFDKYTKADVVAFHEFVQRLLATLI